MKKIKTGVIGCGAIAPAYLGNLKKHFSGLIEVAACADLTIESAVRRAAEFEVPKACQPAEMLADPTIELVINLTPAPAHHAVSLQILGAGKHLFTEKPLALSREHGREILETAARRGLRVAGAADTFLGSGLQLCRKLIDEGRIGTPIAAQAMIGVPLFHHAVYHHVFRGILLDLGPYYLTALVALLGPVTRVSGAAEIRFPVKPHAPDGPDAGKSFVTDIPSSVSASFDFADGTVASMVASGDITGYARDVAIYGTAATIMLNDANFYGGKVILRTPRGSEEFDMAPGFGEKGRGLGVAEMALALREGAPPRCNGELMYHVMDALLAVRDSSTTDRHVRLASRVERPAPFDYSRLANARGTVA